MTQFVHDPRTGRLAQPGQTIRSAATAATRVGWDERNRPRVDNVLGYSRFVRIMKVMLPLVAFSLIVLVVIYSTYGGEKNKIQLQAVSMDSVDKDRALVHPKLTGTDGRGQPFTVTATGATQAPGKTKRMVFDDVVADVTMQDKSWVQVDAKTGLLDGEAKTLDLTESINIFSDKGYECHTTAARYDFGLGLLKGEQPINCQGPLGLIGAKKFEGLRDPGIMRFSGGVTTTYFPAAREGKAKDAAETNPEGIAEPVADDNPTYSGPAPVTAAPIPAPTQPKPKSVTP